MLECLAILGALRTWQHIIDTKRVSLVVRGDNVGALILLVKMRPKTARLAIIARELALLTARAAFPPDVEHTPGLAHQVADGLSRMYDPHSDYSRVLQHPALVGAVHSEVDYRCRSWYKALDDFTPLDEQVGHIVGS